SEEHTSELQSLTNLVCRLLLEKKNTKLIAQHLIVNDKVTVLTGFGVTPAALAVAPAASEGTTPEIVTAAGTSSIAQTSPYNAPTSFRVAPPSLRAPYSATTNFLKRLMTTASSSCPTADRATLFGDDWPHKPR